MAKTYLKDYMVNALKDLSRTKPFQKITINDIVKECEISKQTFYNHFKDKNDLLLYTFELKGRQELKLALSAGLDYKAAIKYYYENALSQKYFYRSFMYDPSLQIILLNSIQKTSTDYVKKQIECHCGTSELTPELNLAIRFNSAGNSKLFLDWIIDNMKTSPEIMAEVNFSCIPEPLKSYFIYEKIVSIP